MRRSGTRARAIEAKIDNTSLASNCGQTDRETKVSCSAGAKLSGGDVSEAEQSPLFDGASIVQSYKGDLIAILVSLAAHE